MYPLSYLLTRGKWIRLNRYAIKITHFPMLLIIFLFERLYLRPRSFVPNDLLLTRTQSIETIRGELPAIALGKQRSVSGAIFSKLRRDSQTFQRREQVLSQVFSTTQHARRLQGYGSNARHQPRVDDWFKKLPDRFMSPGGNITSNDNTPDQTRARNSYFGTSIHQRISNADNGIYRRTAPIRTSMRNPSGRLVSGVSSRNTVQSDPEDSIPFEAGISRELRKRQRPSFTSTNIAHKLEEEDAEYDQAVEVDADAEHSDEDTSARTITAMSSTNTTPCHRRNESQQTVRKLDMRGRPNESTISSLMKPKAIAPKNIRQNANYSMRSRKDFDEPLGGVPSSLATQLAAHGGGGEALDDDVLSRLLVSRIERIESSVNTRIENVERLLGQLTAELRKSRKAEGPGADTPLI